MALKIGVIGCGGIGNRHSINYKSLPGSELVCVCDMDKERADKLAKNHGVKAYYDVGEMLKKEKLDAASVCTAGAENGGHHYQPTMQCLEAGLHVLCEKPISNDIEQGRRMVARAKELKRCFGINLNHRFTPLTQRAKGWVVEGKLGEGLIINMLMWINNKNDSSPWFHVKALHPHSIDVMRYFAGPVRKVQCFMMKPTTRKACWSNLSINLQFANGMIGHLTGSYDVNPAHGLERCEFIGTSGRFYLDNLFDRLTLFNNASDERTVIERNMMKAESFDDTFKNRIARWVEQLNEGADPEKIEASGRDGLGASEITHAAIESFEKGTVIDLEDRG